MLADRIDQLGPGQTARVDGLLNVLDFLRGELASGQNLWRSVSDQHAAAPKRPPYHLKTVFACPLLFCDKKFLQVGLSCSNFTGSRTMRQSCPGIACRGSLMITTQNSPAAVRQRKRRSIILTAIASSLVVLALVVFFGVGRWLV